MTNRFLPLVLAAWLGAGGAQAQKQTQIKSYAYYPGYYAEIIGG